MKISYKNLSLVFAAGCLGGLANSLAVWSFGALGLTKALGVHLAPALTPGWLYPRLVWGGIWGILFLLPLPRLSMIVQGLILSLGPTLAQLFLVFPLAAHKGVLGLQLGPLTPALAIFFNAVWGITAGVWLKLTDESK
jgi:hypothetical protein